MAPQGETEAGTSRLRKYSTRTTAFFLPIIFAAAFLNTAQSGSCTPPAAPDTPPTLTQLASCFPNVEVAGEVLPEIPFERSVNIYRDGAFVESLLTGAQGAFVWQDRSCDLELGTPYSYHFTYTTTSQSPPSPATEVTLVSEQLNCVDPPACSGAACVGGITVKPQQVADELTPVAYTISSTTPGLTVQFEAVPTPAANFWVPVGPPVTTGGTPVCVNEESVYQATWALTIPPDIWEAGATGSYTYLRARTQGDPPQDTKVYSDWDDCVANNPDLSPEQLLQTCPVNPSSFFALATSNYTLVNVPAPTIALQELTCKRAVVSLNGSKTIFLDGLPVHGYGSTNSVIDSLMPGQTYELRASVFVNGANGPVSAPLTFTTPECEVPLPIWDGDFNIGIFLVVLQDVTAPFPFTPEEYRDWVFGDPDDDSDGNDSFRDYIEEVSRGQATTSGDVVGWVVLPYDVADFCGETNPDGTGSVCDVFAVETAARQYLFGATAYGSYGHKALIVHGATTYGVGTTGQSNLSSERISPLYLLLHESFGHGVMTTNNHSSTLICEGGYPEGGPVFALGSGCTIWEYGDVYDPLGSANVNHFNTHNLLRLGFLSTSETAETTASDGDASEHWVGALNSTAYPIKQLRVALKRGGLLFLEFRNHFGFNGKQPCPECDPPFSGNQNLPPEGLQMRLNVPVELVDWKTAAVSEETTYLLRDGGPENGGRGQPVILSADNPVFGDFGVRIEVLEQNFDGIRVRVEQ